MFEKKLKYAKEFIKWIDEKFRNSFSKYFTYWCLQIKIDVHCKYNWHIVIFLLLISELLSFIFKYLDLIFLNT